MQIIIDTNPSQCLTADNDHK